MTLAELYNLLSSITGFTSKVTYRAWPEGEAPELPFICYLERGTDNFKADSKVYHKINDVDIELYTNSKEPGTELLVENALDSADISWDKHETYIDDEHCYQITYSITI